MPNLVGIGNSQVPTNAMLGGLAYQDSVGEIDIDKIKARTSDTAVDVFVYDTRKDSDGGAWRHRTQNTSWYNEGASATRGARKEFPAVAVIVATTDTYTIYDGDDPNMSMWMVFESDGSSGARVARSGTDAITMLNGLMCAVRSGSQRAAGFASFISDNTYQIDANGRYDTIGGWDGIVNRNVTGSWTNANSTYAVAGNGTMYDVAMIVLPNAPIDASTGLPVPTIAVATNGGFSVIKDDGSVIDKGVTSTVTNEVGWYKGQYLLGSGPEYWALWKDLSEESSGYISGTADLYSAGNQASWDKPQPTGNETKVVAVGDVIAGGSATAYNNNQQPGLSLKHPTSNLSNGSSNLLCEIRKDYNTGWMHGDIQGTFLADTDDTNLTDGNNIVNNGTFDSNVSGWYGDSGAAVSWDSGGFALVTNGGGDNTYAIAQSGILVVGKKYRITGRVNPAIPSGSYEFRVRAGGSGTSWNKTSGLTNGSWYSFDTGVVTADGTKLEIGSNGGNITSFYIDDVVVKEFDDDRSVKNNGIEVFGTITKEPVATGAELVAYGPFSGSNFLRQPPNSNMNIGTGDAYEIIWFKTTNSSDTMMLISYEGGANGTTDYGKPFNIRYESGVVRGWASHNAFSTYDDVSHGTSTSDGKWHCAAWVKRGQVFELYVDGKFSGSDTSAVGSNALSDSNSELVIGARKRGKYTFQAHEERFDGSLALARIGKSAPSAEQIKKIYEDEKHLFNENAKCTLHGTSDAVTALAFDDTTNVLHVGTSSGRSEFQSLNRINNTTTAVTTAISASNEFVAEQ